MPAGRGSREITVRAVVPNRVDLAGGTLDIFPLYLLVPGSITVNAAVGLASRVEIRKVGGAARLVSEGIPAKEEAPDTRRFPGKGPLGLVAAALRSLPPLSGVEIRFRNEAPVGTGMGSSSALLVAVLLAVDRVLGRRGTWKERARKAVEIEALHLRHLTGRQDHVAALRGGIQGIRFLPGDAVADRIGPKSRPGRMLAERGVLAHTGVSHFSAGVNWRMIRGAIDGNPRVLGKFAGIADAAREAWDAVSAGDMDRLGRAVAREWSIRKTIAPGISTRKVEEALASPLFRRKVGGAKLCGAGGGGMLFALLTSPEARPEVESFLSARGFAVYPFRLSAGPRLTGGGGVP